MEDEEKFTYTKSSGNVFKDLGLSWPKTRYFICTVQIKYRWFMYKHFGLYKKHWNDEE